MFRLFILLPIPLLVLFIPQRYVRYYLILLTGIAALFFVEAWYSHQSGGESEAVGMAIVLITVGVAYVLAMVRAFVRTAKANKK